ncbi:hypothetical protein [Halobellus salinisoli]|uniref:hypothetical protein n=1 Tax=Halobellus salinisoli TaxID=3108500 RepID=UPI0031F315E4
MDVVAELEGKQTDESTTIYVCIDGMISELYSSPPSPAAQMTVEFTYRRTHRTILQDGLSRPSLVSSSPIVSLSRFANTNKRRTTEINLLLEGQSYYVSGES